MSAKSDSGGGTEAGAETPKLANTSLSLVGDYGCSDSDSGDEASHDTAEGSQDVKLSEMVLKNNIINACAHGPLPETSTDESSHILIDSNGSGDVIEYSISEYREQDSDDTVSSDSSSEVNSVKDADEIDSSDEDSPEAEGGARQVPRVRGELLLEDLPPIEELSISVPANQVKAIGKIFNIVDKLVIVQALPGTPAVDLASVLFLDHGRRALGRVFDVFGQVSEPHYCVRFNSVEQIKDQKLELGQDVYIAPNTNHTSFVLVSQLMKMRGSDASWQFDVEPPPSQLEFSDDEEERRAKKERRRPTAQARSNQETAGQPDVRRTQPTRFEEQMNRRNLQRTAEAHRFAAPSPHFRNPFGAMRHPPPPAPAQPPPPHPWVGGDSGWPREDAPPCPPYMLARPTFEPYGQNCNIPMMGLPHGRPHFARPGPFGFGRPPPPGFGQVMPWFSDNPPPPPPPNS